MRCVRINKLTYLLTYACFTVATASVFLLVSRQPEYFYYFQGSCCEVVQSDRWGRAADWLAGRVALASYMRRFNCNKAAGVVALNSLAVCRCICVRQVEPSKRRRSVSVWSSLGPISVSAEVLTSQAALWVTSRAAGAPKPRDAKDD